MSPADLTFAMPRGSSPTSHPTLIGAIQRPHERAVQSCRAPEFHRRGRRGRPPPMMKRAPEPLWCEKRGEAEPEDLSGNLIVQLGLATEALNRNCYERKTGQVIECVQHRLRHPVLQWMGATLDGNGRRQRGGVRGQVHAAVVVFRGRGGREAHGVWVTNSKAAALSVITGAANGSRSPLRLIRSTSTCSWPPRRSFGAAWRPASPLAYSVSSRRCPASLPFVASP